MTNNNVITEAKAKVNFYENMINGMIKDKKLQNDEITEASLLKKAAKQEAKRAYHKDKSDLINLDYMRGVGLDEARILTLVPAWSWLATPLMAITAARIDGAASAIGVLTESICYFPIGVIGIGVMAVIRGIKNIGAKKAAFNQAYANKLKNFVNHVNAKTNT